MTSRRFGSTLKLLIVEDSPADVRLLEELLHTETHRRFVLQSTGTLQVAVSMATAQEFDAVLLDLGLPDAEGSTAVVELREQCSSLPIVVLTDRVDPEMAAEALHAGAQDYLVKGRFDGDGLIRAVDYAIERHRLYHALEEAVSARERDKALARTEGLMTPTTAATAGSYGEYLIRETRPDVYELLVDEYKSLIVGAVERQMYQDVPALKSRTRAIADRFGTLRAAPRDVIDVHAAAIKAASGDANRVRRSAMSIEAQFLVLEVMGYLALYYRTFMSGPVHERAE